MYSSKVLFAVFLLLIKNTDSNQQDRETQADPSGLPNIVIFLVDDLGYGDLSFTGHPTSRTPNIDALAENGRFLSHFYVTSPVCSPSRSSFLTGRYQSRTGTYPAVYMPESIYGLPNNETTIGKLLKDKGYKTQYIGKWHLGVGANREYLPSNPEYGFDNFFGLPYSHDMCPCTICFPEDVSCFQECWSEKVSCALFDNEDIIDQPVYLPDLTPRLVDRAVNFLDQFHTDNSPFLLYFAFQHIHHPQFSSGNFVNASDRGVVGSALLELDWAVETIVNNLKENNLLDDTLIWFTSDNGPSLLRHERGGCAGLLRCGKGTTWDGGVRVPAIIHWPNKITPGRSNSLTSSLDILPTLASLVGANTSHLTLDGMDISQVLFDQDSKSPREFFAVYPELPSIETGPFAIIYGKYKAHFYTRGSALSDYANFDPMCPESHNLTSHDPPLLFDLYADPGERYDLSPSNQYQDIVKLMTDWRDEHMRTMTWMSSRTVVLEERAQPCCTSPICDPYPSCCDCPTNSERKPLFH